MTLDPIWAIVDGHAEMVSPETLPVRYCACGQPTGSPTFKQCRACLHAEIAANTAKLKREHPEVFHPRLKGWRDKRYNGS